jgi:prepilin-type N-terminal cleavage/methylation domain-containing protein
MNSRLHNQQGFTLVELAIVLVIVALLLGGMMMSMSAQRDVSNINETQKRLTEIRETLLGYAVINSRLPCPMPLTVTNPADAMYGVAATSCAAGTEGILPWKTLGVLEVDPWGTPRTLSTQSFDGYWRYRVAPSFATTFLLSTPSTTLSVINNTGNTLTEATEAPVAIVFSTGSDLVANGENGGTVNTIYRAGERTQSFDDLLIWIGRPLLFNKMIGAGKLP